METEKTESANKMGNESKLPRKTTNRRRNRSGVWQAIIAGICLLTGAIIGGFFTKSSADVAAKTQLTAVWIQVYGPIFATQTAEARVPPASAPVLASQGEALAIESIPQNVFVFAGNDKPDGGRGEFFVIYDEEHIPIYRMKYSLPEDKYGYAGLVFQFPGGYNLSAYKAIAFTIIFKEPGDKIDLFIKDISNNENIFHLVGDTDSEMNFTYEFSNLKKTNFNAVKEIGVFASTDIAKGDHEVRIKNVRFVR